MTIYCTPFDQDTKQATSASTELVVVCGGGYSPEKMQRRNAWMVDHCDFLLACWDGSPGGTGNCMAYARAKWGDQFEQKHYNCYSDIDWSVIPA